jgi:stress response protein SCP2
MTAATVLQRGANTSLAGASTSKVLVALGWGQLPAGFEVDASTFLLKSDSKVRGDADMIFYNNPRNAENSVEALTNAAAAGGADAQVFELDLAQMPQTIEKVAFTVTIDQAKARGQSFGQLTSAYARVVDPAAKAELARFELPLAGTSEAALVFAEVYRRNGVWKFRAVGQGFNGGLAPLAQSYGIDVADDAPAAANRAPAAAPTRNSRLVNLEKKLISLERKDPQLVSLTKNAAVSLEKKGLLEHQAKVALCLDISGSMSHLYSSGAVAALVQRVLALALRFDDDGDIDVFLFGKDPYEYGAVDAGSYRDFVPNMRGRYALEGGTYYGKAVKMIREHYAGDASFGHLPVYVMFVTDGDTMDNAVTEKQLKEASREAIFWQFMAIGEKKRGLFGSGASFPFLEKLDNLKGLAVDNANFFQVESPTAPSDEEMYDLLMDEYPDWLKAARKKGILA